MMSSCLIPPLALLQDHSRAHLWAAFLSTLGTIDRCEWYFVPKGSVLVEYDDKPPLLAEEDYAEIHAFGGST